MSKYPISYFLRHMILKNKKTQYYIGEISFFLAKFLNLWQFSKLLIDDVLIVKCEHYFQGLN